MRVIISGGGTGGHIYPAVAIANEIRRQKPDSEILFVGALGKMEMTKVPKEGYKIVGLPVVGFNRSNMLANLSFPFKLLKSLYLAKKIVKDFQPDIAVGVGGFASGPTLKAANAMGVKTLLQEQNSYAGVTNKLLSKRARRVCVAYPDMESYFPKEKIVFTGNPVRNDMLLSGIDKSKACSHFGLDSTKPTLLVIGGSLGAVSINKGISSGMDEILQKGIQIIWQTGKNFSDEDLQLASGKSGLYVSEFIYEMDKAYAAADLVVSRAGAMSVSEIALVGKASVLVPFPFAAEDHQTKNAESLSKNDAAILISDKNIETELIPTVLGLFTDKSRILRLESEVKKFAKPNAAKDIVGEILKIVAI